MESSEIIERLHQAETGAAAQLLHEVLRAGVRTALYAIVEQEISGLCGRRHRPDKEATCVRAGSAKSDIYLDGRRVEAKRPRVRRKCADGGSVEVHLKTWQTAQSPDAWEDAMMRAIMCGVSTRDQQRMHETELRGMSKSSVSRLWQRKAAELVSELMGRDLSAEPVLAMMLDGVHLADNLYTLIAVGIRADGSKDVLGFRVGTSENNEVARDLMSDLVGRGLRTAEGLRLLTVLDGSDPLRRAVLEFFPQAVTQRCLIHKERNIKRYLPSRHWLRLTQLFSDLRKAQGAEAALEALERIQVFLSDKNKAARDSLEEAGPDLLAFFRLEVPSTLNKTFLSTNVIENAIRNLRRHIGRVCRWRHENDHPERWIASGLKLAGRGFRKVHGHRDLNSLVHALRLDKTHPRPHELRAASGKSASPTNFNVDSRC